MSLTATAPDSSTGHDAAMREIERRVLWLATAIVEAWRKYYEGDQPPFSWEPEQVEVVDSGTLAYSGGPVHDASGKVVGRFNSIWRLEAPGQWKIVFDRGEAPSCQCKPKVDTP